MAHLVGRPGVNVSDQWPPFTEHGCPPIAVWISSRVAGRLRPLLPSQLESWVLYPAGGHARLALRVRFFLIGFSVTFFRRVSARPFIDRPHLLNVEKLLASDLFLPLIHALKLIRSLHLVQADTVEF